MREQKIADLVAMVEKAAQRTKYDNDALERKAVMAVEADIIGHAIAMGLDPCGYLDLYEMRMTEYRALANGVQPYRSQDVGS